MSPRSSFTATGRESPGLALARRGSWNNTGNGFEKALDGNLKTFFDAPIPAGAYVGMDIQQVDALSPYLRQ
jgi:hypothetical protein